MVLTLLYNLEENPFFWHNPAITSCLKKFQKIMAERLRSSQYSDRQEESICKEIDEHIGKRPWCGVEVYSRERFTYKANIKPVDSHSLETVKYLITGSDPERRNLLHRVQIANTEIFDTTSTIGIVLDGRKGSTAVGWLGDVIEASRIVSVLRYIGKEVEIYTPHVEVFVGTKDKGVKIVKIPGEIPGSPLYPWNPQLIEFLGKKVKDIPFLFPTNAHMPVLTKIDETGVRNHELILQLKRAIRPNSQYFGIVMGRWAKYKVHQLQALQVLADLIGIRKVGDWQDFPPAYLYPSDECKMIARKVLERYNCVASDSSILFVHPGVAIDRRKLEEKYYPEEKWTQVLEHLQGYCDDPVKLVLLTPIDKQQAAMTERLTDYAKRIGFAVAQIPMRQVQEEFGWSLGSFVSFLNGVSQKRGMIVGVDSMPAGHLGPALGMQSVVIGNKVYNPSFFCPPRNALVVMPSSGRYSSGVDPSHTAFAIKEMLVRGI